MYRVGLLVGTETLPEWVARALERVAEQPETEITLVVRVTEEENTGPSSNMPGLADWAYRMKVALFGEAKSRRQLSEIDCLDSARHVECETMPADTVGVTFPPEIVSEMSAVDVAVHVGVGIIKGDILTAPTDGILSYHHGDIREYRGSSAGFWEFLNDEDEIGVTLQQLTETLDGGRIVVLERVDISDAHTLNEIRNRARAVSEEMLPEAISRLKDPSFSPEQPDSLGKLYYQAERQAYGVVIKFQLKNTLGRVRKLLGG